MPKMIFDFPLEIIVCHINNNTIITYKHNVTKRERNRERWREGHGDQFIMKRLLCWKYDSVSIWMRMCWWIKGKEMADSTTAVAADSNGQEIN